jgi:hypothetical protein
MTDRPLHPWNDDRLFQHPIRGFVIRDMEQLRCFANDIPKGANQFKSSDDDTDIYLGVELFRSRCELGAWLTERHPRDEHRLINHMFVEEVFPSEFEGESAETMALLGRVDMAQDVMDAGGACTICEAPNVDGDVDHVVGCEYLSWLMYRLATAIRDADGEPSLAEVVRAAHEQIARM